MRRLSPQDGARALADGRLGPDYVEQFDEIDKNWDIVTHILASGQRDGELPLTAQAIEGGVVLENDEPDFGGTRLISPAHVNEISQDLQRLGDTEISARYETLDFTGRYGAEGTRPASPVEHSLSDIHELQSFYARAAAEGSAIAVWYG